MEWRRSVHSESGISFLHYAFGVKSLHHIRTKSLDRTSWRVGSREKKNAGGMNQNCHQEVGCYCYWWVWDEVKKIKERRSAWITITSPSLITCIGISSHSRGRCPPRSRSSPPANWKQPVRLGRSHWGSHSPNRQSGGSLELTAVTVDHWQQRSVREVEHLHRKMIERWSLFVLSVF